MTDMNPEILSRLKDLDPDPRELAEAVLQLPPGMSERAAVDLLVAKVREMVRRRARS